MPDDRKAVLVRITGRVQEVNFRAWTRTEAERLGLDGWVRNEHDGSVSALIVGEVQAVAAMLERFRSGPPSARVSGIATQEAALGEAAPGFRIVG